MTEETTETEHPDRRQKRRRFARMWGALACGLLASGFLLSKGSGGVHDIGVLAFGYGIGVAVAAAFLALGYEPRRRT
jgi:hypothetical protein